MGVFSLRVGESGKITEINLSGAAKERLTALGIKRGAAVKVLGFSLFKSGVLLGAGNTRVAVRKAVAENIKVEKC